VFFLEESGANEYKTWMRVERLVKPLYEVSRYLFFKEVVTIFRSFSI